MVSQTIKYDWGASLTIYPISYASRPGFTMGRLERKEQPYYADLSSDWVAQDGRFWAVCIKKSSPAGFRTVRLQRVDEVENGVLLAAHLGRYQTAIVLWKANYELHFFTYEKPELADVVKEGFCQWTVTRGREATEGMSHAERARYALQHFLECCDTLGWARPKMEVLQGEEGDFFTHEL